MKKAILMLALGFMCVKVEAQRLMVGNRAPDMKVQQWYQNKAIGGTLPRYVEFFSINSKPSLDRVGEVERLAKQYADRMGVAILLRESAEEVGSQLTPAGYHVGFDHEGKSFKNYEVNYLPFAVILDRKNNLLWFGNPSTLTDAQLEKILK